MFLNRCSVLLLLILLQLTSYAQQPQDAAAENTGKLLQLPGKFIGAVNKKISSLDRQLTRQTEKYLQRLAKREKKLQRKLSRLDSTAAQKLFDKSNAGYTGLVNELKNPPSITSYTGAYLPHTDSLNGMLRFLTQNNELLQKSGALKDKLQGSYGQLQQLQSKMAVADKAKEFVRQRRQQIKAALGRYTKLPKGITKGMDDFKRNCFYYQKQIQEYKSLLNDPDKLEKKALSLLTKIPAFQQFMKEHGQLAGLFGPLPTSPPAGGGGASLAGLQTRSQVQQLIQGRLAAGGQGAQNVLQQNLQAAQAQLNKLKDKINKLGSGSEDMEMPDFSPDNQKTKSFWRRLEWGTNIQSTKSNYFFPTTTDIGLSIGYKLSDHSVIGIGGSAKIGFGKDIRHIALTGEGFSIRSFLDVKVKNSLFVSGGFEFNRQQPFSELQQLGEFHNFQKSALIGVSKVISLKTKFFKNTKAQLLFDMLSSQQVPRTAPLKFRLGYNF